MEPKFQTSFIPKNAVIASETHMTAPMTSSLNILPTIAGIIFVLSLVAAGGLFGYQHLLNSQIVADNKSLSLVQSEFDPQTMNSLIAASNRIKGAQNLLNKHIATSNMFAVLEQDTLPQVRFDTFNFQVNQDGTMTMALTGEATSYATLAEQSSIFSTVSYFENSAFSNLTLLPNGSVSMHFNTDINPALVSYKTVLQNTQ
jgi:hypothetical protein